MNQLNKILLQTHNATGHPLRKIAPLALVSMVVGVALFIAYGLAGTAHVQAESGAIPSLTLDSNEPGQLVINWQAPDPAPTDYRLSWANSSLEFLSYKDSNEAQRGNVYPAGGVTTLTLNNLTPGDTYKVQMRSRYYNGDGSGRQSSGPWTATATQRVKNHPPAAPTSLTASEVAHDSLILSWDDPQDTNITGYRIQRGTDANSLNTIEPNTGSPSTNYTDSTVEPETTYHYAVQALSQDGNGARSITSVTTPAEPKETVQNDPPPAPTGLMAARVGHSVLTLTWDDPQDDTITGYRVLRGPSADNLSIINSDTASSTTEYEDDTVAPDTTYHYAVTALSANGDGAQSSTISATTTAAPKSKDPPPQGVGARQSITTTEVPADWSLTPTGLAAGDQFRLLFLSSTKRDGSATDIATYNTFVQGLAAAGHADIQSYSTGFQVVGCTADTDARDNTSTTYTSTDKGVPIYWLNGAKAADEYEDFYDGDWDDEANDKNESGTNGPDTSVLTNYPVTGCQHDGTESSPNGLGTSHASGLRVGRPNSSDSAHGPIGSDVETGTANNRPMYGLSAVFQVAVAASTPATGTPAITAPNVFRVPAVLGVDLTGITDTDGTTGIATTATYKWQRFAADGTTLDTDSIGTDSTYILTDADAGKTLKVVVSFTDDASNSEGPLTSAATAAITAAASCAAPTLTGGAVFLGPARKVGVGTYLIGAQSVYGFSVAEGEGSLDNVTFTTAASNDYEILILATADFGMAFQTATRLTAADRMTVVLHICDQAYAVASVLNPTSVPAIYFFPTPSQDWSSHAERTIYLSQDTVAPTFASATVNGTSLVITFNEPLGAAGSLANSAFTVKKNGSATALTYGATAPVISGSTVTLTLATASSVTASDTNVLVTYTKPGTGTANKLLDAFGNETGTFEDQAVTNLLSGTNAPAAGTPAVTAPNAFRVPAVLGVDLSGITDADGTTNIASSATYKWQRFAADGTTLDTDSIGTDATYTLTDADAGKTLKVVVSFTDDASNSEGPLTSAATSAITAAATDCNAPTLTGGATFLGSARKVGVGIFGGGMFYGFSKTLGSGSLDNAAFTSVTSKDYEIVSLGTSNGAVAIQLDQRLSAPDQSTLVMHICDQAYEFRTRSEPAMENPYYLFAMTGQDWSPHAERTIYLSQEPPSVPLVSNLEQTADASATYTRDHGQAFTTGSNSGGYTVTSVTIRTEDPNNDAIPLQICEVDSSTHPTTVCTDLTAPDTFPQNTALVYNAPTSPALTLDADTTYMLVFKAPPSPTALRVGATTSDSEDSTSLAGWSIRNTYQWYNNSNTWADATNARAIRLIITGKANTNTNAPAAGVPAVTAPNAFRVPAVLGVDLSGITDADGTTGIASNATYKWQRFAANGTTLDTDSIGTASIYTLTDADAGKTLKVVVSFTDDGGNSEGPLTSAATRAITAAATDCNAPTLTGGAVFLGSARKVGVGEFDLGGHAYWGFNKAENAGSINNASFTTAASNNYEILGAATRSRDDWLLVLDAALPANVQRTLAVHFCDEDIAFNAATPRPRDGIYYYTSDTLLQNWVPHAERTIYLSQDTAAPTFASATVSGTTLVITLSEDLGAAGSLANSAFTVKKGPSGSQTTLTLSSTAPVISGSTVTLTLATASSVTAFGYQRAGDLHEAHDGHGQQAAGRVRQRDGDLRGPGRPLSL